MADIALEPAARRSHAELAEILTAGYEGYYTPFAVDEAAFRFMATVWDDDLEASRVAVVGGEPAGIAKLAIRGDRGWIAGIGVAVPWRGQGVGEALMRGVLDEARARGLREVWLEVLVQNEPAIRLYEKLGFEHERELEVWTLEPLVFQEHKVRPVRSSRRTRASGASERDASRGSAPTRRSRTSTESRGLRVTAAPCSSGAPESGSRCCRAWRRTSPLPASWSRDFRPRRPRWCG